MMVKETIIEMQLIVFFVTFYDEIVLWLLISVSFGRLPFSSMNSARALLTKSHMFLLKTFGFLYRINMDYG